MKVEIVSGNIIHQDVEVIVNSWNRNIIPWWLLIPQGISGAIKKNAGIQPFKEVAKCGSIPLGEARLTSAGRLNYKGIIHVAGINMFWFANKYSITKSVENAMNIVNQQKFKSVAFPLIGAGSGNRSLQFSHKVMLESFNSLYSKAKVIIVHYDGSS
ncbi:MAG: macro domain-containing protein [Marinicellaceae bacterium]